MINITIRKSTSEFITIDKELAKLNNVVEYYIYDVDKRKDLAHIIDNILMDKISKKLVDKSDNDYIFCRIKIHCNAGYGKYDNGNVCCYRVHVNNIMKTLLNLDSSILYHDFDENIEGSISILNYYIIIKNNKESISNIQIAFNRNITNKNLAEIKEIEYNK